MINSVIRVLHGLLETKAVTHLTHAQPEVDLLSTGALKEIPH